MLAQGDAGDPAFDLADREAHDLSGDERDLRGEAVADGVLEERGRAFEGEHPVSDLERPDLG